MRPNARSFEAELNRIFREAEAAGRSCVDISSRDLHNRLGGYSGNSNHRMATCCNVMRRLMTSNDEIIHQPPRGRGASLTIRYALPRESWQAQLLGLVKPNVLTEHDIAVLAVDLPEHRLLAGDVGTISFVHGEGSAYTVEFAGLDGETVAVITAYPDQIRPPEAGEIPHVRLFRAALTHRP